MGLLILFYFLRQACLNFHILAEADLESFLTFIIYLCACGVWIRHVP